MMRSRLRRGRDAEPGFVLVLSLLLMVLMSLMGVSLLTTASTESTISYNALWSEGALSAAEAGVNAGLNQLSANAQTSAQAVPLTTIAANYAYRSGRRTDAGPQPLTFLGTRVQPGYSLAVGTGYNPSGYAFYTFQIASTGTGPRNATREVEIQAEYGPVPQ